MRFQREGKINQQVKKEILFYWDCDVTKDIGYVDKKRGQENIRNDESL